MKILKLINLTNIGIIIGFNSYSSSGIGFWNSLRSTKLGSSVLGPNSDSLNQQEQLNSINNSKEADKNPNIIGKEFNIHSVDESEAKLWLNYSGIAYCPEDKVKNWNCKHCLGIRDKLEEIIYLKGSKYNVGGFIVVNKADKAIIISYKSPKYSLDWTLKTAEKYKLLNITEEYNGVGVHSGFYKISKNLFKSTEINVKRLINKYPSYKILMTGHSMGGAITTLNAYNLVNKNITTWDKLTLITYGQPRLGNQKFANYINSQNTTIVRVNNEADPIPTVPTPPNYYHFGYALYIHLDSSSRASELCRPDDFNWNCLTSPINLEFGKSHFNYWGVEIDTKCKD